MTYFSVPAQADDVWLTETEIQALPVEGIAWDALVSWAQKPIATPSLANQNDPSNVQVLARAIVATRLSDEAGKQRVRRICMAIIGTEAGANALSVSRELAAYVIAADLVGLDSQDDAVFRAWLDAVLTRSFRGRSITGTHENRPNNWGTHAGATRIAVAIYLGDDAEVRRAADVFRGWLGERDAWQGFKFKQRWWQAEFFRSYAVNPRYATKRGHSVDGVLPDDQRRGGHFSWPPPKENYVYEALQGAMLQAILLERQGYSPWLWGDKALFRAFAWLNRTAEYPAQGDDTWMPYVINQVYASDFTIESPSQPGKGFGFADWVYGTRASMQQ